RIPLLRSTRHHRRNHGDSFLRTRRYKGKPRYCLRLILSRSWTKHVQTSSYKKMARQICHQGSRRPRHHHKESLNARHRRRGPPSLQERNRSRRQRRQSKPLKKSRKTRPNDMRKGLKHPTKTPVLGQNHKKLL
ncbi:hypothetical protein LCGC14_2875470, partial [marine sediment metagenome]